MDKRLIPVEDFTNALSEVSGALTTAELGCQVVIAQPDIYLDEVPAFIPSQKLARKNATRWTENLRGELLNTFTKAKSFANLYGAMTETDVDKLVSLLDSEAGKQEFAKAILRYKDEANTALAAVRGTSGNLKQFTNSLNTDLRDFHQIHSEVVAKYSSQDSRTEQLVQEMATLAEARSQETEAVAVLAAKTGAGVTATLGTVAAGATVSLTKADLVAAPPGPNEEVRRKFGALAALDGQFSALAGEAVAHQQQPAVLQWLSGSYADLGRPRDTALTGLVDAWTATASSFGEIAESAQGTVDEQTRTRVRTNLIQAIAAAKELKTLAEKLEARGVVVVNPTSK